MSSITVSSAVDNDPLTFNPISTTATSSSATILSSSSSVRTAVATSTAAADDEPPSFCEQFLDDCASAVGGYEGFDTAYIKCSNVNPESPVTFCMGCPPGNFDTFDECFNHPESYPIQVPEYSQQIWVGVSPRNVTNAPVGGLSRALKPYVTAWGNRCGKQCYNDYEESDGTSYYAWYVTRAYTVFSCGCSPDVFEAPSPFEIDDTMDLVPAIDGLPGSSTSLKLGAAAGANGLKNSKNSKKNTKTTSVNAKATAKAALGGIKSTVKLGNNARQRQTITVTGAGEDGAPGVAVGSTTKRGSTTTTAKATATAVDRGLNNSTTTTKNGAERAGSVKVAVASVAVIMAFCEQFLDDCASAVGGYEGFDTAYIKCSNVNPESPVTFCMGCPPGNFDTFDECFNHPESYPIQVPEYSQQIWVGVSPRNVTNAPVGGLSRALKPYVTAWGNRCGKQCYNDYEESDGTSYYAWYVTRAYTVFSCGCSPDVFEAPSPFEIDDTMDLVPAIDGLPGSSTSLKLGAAAGANGLKNSKNSKKNTKTTSVNAKATAKAALGGIKSTVKLGNNARQRQTITVTGAGEDGAPGVAVGSTTKRGSTTTTAKATATAVDRGLNNSTTTTKNGAERAGSVKVAVASVAVIMGLVATLF
ncbi:hypothetical protein HDU96_000718 [Phlyctochytrium bullatum]|nr:hypothetical protein HDU96_000718 [Phlyctochytrium bullatum]